MRSETGSRTSNSRRRQALRRDATPWRIALVPTGRDLAAAEAFCRKIAARHYENFTVATRLLPGRLRQPLANVYAFARWADDLADEPAAGASAAEGLAEWRRELEACFAGDPRHPVFVALAETIRRASLPMEPFSALIDAFAEDAALDDARVLVRYATRAELMRYCSRSANPVGRIVLALEGCRDRDLVAMSDGICTGLQLVNFWQDVARDRAAGRVYLPREDMERFGVVESMLDLRRAPASLVALVRDEVAWARECLDAGSGLAAQAPAALRPAIGMFLGGGRAVADAIERAGFDTLAHRPVVSRWKKLQLACRAWWALARHSGGDGR